MSACRVTLLDTGYCVHPEHVVHRNWRARRLRFPAMFALIEHPERGPILFDTGYAQPFLDAMENWPERLYAKVTPVTVSPEQFAAARLRALGVDPADVRLVIASHFHADHVAGLGDFPNARFLYFKSAWERVAKLRGVRALLQGFLPELLPDDFEQRSDGIEESEWSPLPSEFAPFRSGIDLLGDGSLTAVALPGHAAGQLGLIVRRADQPPAFLVADACWTSRAFREGIVPSNVTRLLFDDMRAYRETLGWIGELHRSNPALEIWPSHCSELHARAVTGRAATEPRGESA